MEETYKIPLENPYSICEEDEQKIAKYAKELESSNLVEDIKFREIAKSKEAIQEILRVILNEDDLIVLESIEQKNITESIFHGVILDCLCKLSTGELINIEMQIELRNAPVKRMRYNQSAMTIAHSPKDKFFDYNKIPNIISIMFCEFDIFGLCEPIYEIKRIINESKVVSYNGVREIYVNLTAETSENKLKELFNILTKINYFNKHLFPSLTETKKKNNDLKGGDRVMSGLTREIYLDGYASGEKRGEERGEARGEARGKEIGILEGKAEGILTGMKELLVEMYNNNMVTKEYAAEKLNITEEEFLKLIK